MVNNVDLALTIAVFVQLGCKVKKGNSDLLNQELINLPDSVLNGTGVKRKCIYNG